MSSGATSSKSPVHLKGSVDIVVEFFNYGINSILYQRGLYPSETFVQREKYGLPLLMTNKPDLRKYLDIILNQLRRFLESKNVHKIVIVILRRDTNEPVERWQFDVELEASTKQDETQKNTQDGIVKNEVDERRALKEIQEGIRGVIRQITASVTFLPTLEGSHTFDILLYTDKDVELPNPEWADTTAKLINNGQHVQLRGFTTHVHRVEPVVSYVTHND